MSALFDSWSCWSCTELVVISRPLSIDAPFFVQISLIFYSYLHNTILLYCIRNTGHSYNSCFIANWQSTPKLQYYCGKVSLSIRSVFRYKIVPSLILQYSVFVNIMHYPLINNLLFYQVQFFFSVLLPDCYIFFSPSLLYYDYAILPLRRSIMFDNCT